MKWLARTTCKGGRTARAQVLELSAGTEKKEDNGHLSAPLEQEDN